MVENDFEAQGKLTDAELYQITAAVTSDDERRIQSMLSLRNMCNELHGTSAGGPCSHQNDSARTKLRLEQMPVIFQSDPSSELSLCGIQKQIRTMPLVSSASEQGMVGTSTRQSAGSSGPGIDDLLASGTQKAKNAGLGDVTLMMDQDNIVNAILEAIFDGKNGYNLVFLHSGGGTGKSTVVCRLNEKLTERGFTQANCCPTGVGTTHLPMGRTFHSMFKTHKLHLNAGRDIDDIKETLGGDKLKLVVVDEVLMLQTSFLTLLDHRLRAMYDPDLPFGGIAVLLLGDFLQLPSVVAGTPLFRLMYQNIKMEDAPAICISARKDV